jgi:PKD domain
MFSATWGRRAPWRLPALALIAIFTGIVAPGTALAQPPANDDFDAAVVIGGLPFQTSLSTSEATAAADDPTNCTNNGSVWFSFTPDHDLTIDADTFGSAYDTVLSAYTGTRGALTQVSGACNDDSSGLQSRIVFAATAGTTYHFLIGQCCGSGGSGGGSLTFSVAGVNTATNDNFANAVAIPGLPFTQTADGTGVTLEPGEPTGSCGTIAGSLWYSFTPAETGSVTARATSSGIPVITVFTGNSLNALTEVGCSTFSPLTFRAVAGQTYHLQLGAIFDPGLVRLSLDVAPAVTARFGFSPSDPSTFDSVSFFDFSFDPGGAQITTWQWQFGDGTSGTGAFPTHRYAADGDFPVSLTATTADGRSGSTSQVVHVRTHDVSVDRFTVPNTARTGQTRQLTVTVKNVRYDQNVRVELYKSTASGFVQVGALTQFVAARPNRTTEFPFNYTFTSDDAAIGKVTFRAVAVITDGRDALPSDNEVISTPTTVN